MDWAGRPSTPNTKESVQMATQTKTKTTVFTSRISRLRVLLSPEIPPQFDTAGRQVAGKVQERVVLFNHGQFVADEQTARKLGMDLPELVQRLRDHDQYLDGTFFEVPVEVAAPDPTPELQRITRLAALGDRGALLQLVEEEQAGWGREVVVEAAGEAVQLLEPQEPAEG